MELSVSLRVIFLLVCPWSCGGVCPPGWSDVTNVGLGCLLFTSSSMVWTEAEQYCNTAATNASLIEIHTEQVITVNNQIFYQ